MLSEHLVMGNEMLRSLEVFGYGEVVHKMHMADLMPLSVNEKHLSVVWCGRCLRVSLLYFLFFHRKRLLAAATCPSVVHTHLRCSKVRKNQRQHCTAHFNTGWHGHVFSYCLNIILETEFLAKVDIRGLTFS